MIALLALFVKTGRRDRGVWACACNMVGQAGTKQKERQRPGALPLDCFMEPDLSEKLGRGHDAQHARALRFFDLLTFGCGGLFWLGLGLSFSFGFR